MSELRFVRFFEVTVRALFSVPERARRSEDFMLFGVRAKVGESEVVGFVRGF